MAVHFKNARNKRVKNRDDLALWDGKTFIA